MMLWLWGVLALALIVLWRLFMNLKDSLTQRLAAIDTAVTGLLSRVTALEGNALTAADRATIEAGLDSVVTQLNGIATTAPVTPTPAP
jgi:hypothetical protein